MKKYYASTKVRFVTAFSNLEENLVENQIADIQIKHPHAEVQSITQSVTHDERTEQNMFVVTVVMMEEVEESEEYKPEFVREFEEFDDYEESF